MTELGDFLQSRRARLRPEDTGLPAFGGRRRVPGLRGEELAQLAGVSADYYSRLEQGRLGNVSDEVRRARSPARCASTTASAHTCTTWHGHRATRAPRAAYGPACAGCSSRSPDARPTSSAATWTSSRTTGWPPRCTGSTWPNTTTWPG
ncbi:helix-turn-helix domain-containing protein [Amycolatopsis lurida]